jgi:basic membrane protein A
MKKILVTVLAVIMAMSTVFGMTACNKSKKNEFKVGLICLHDSESTYDKNFIDAFYAATDALGLSRSQVIVKTNIDESAACYEAAKDLVDSGCDIIFADSFGHEDFMIQAAKEFPNVQFCHATGTKAHTENLANFHNAFASIYEGRYLAGVAAGLKIKEMIDNEVSVNGTKVTAETAKMGYVGAWPYAEVKSGYTSFYLGAKSVVPTVTMDVSFTNSWYSEKDERETAEKFIQDGCILISQHADSMGAPSACEAKGVPNVSYNGSTLEKCPTTFIVSSRIDWAPYYKMAITATKNGEAIPADYVGDIKSGSVVLTDINTAVAAAGTVDKLNEVKAQLVAGTLKVFDTSKFTVDGQNITSYMADVDSDENYTRDTQVIAGGEFQESKFRSAPYFDINIDGITIK